MMSAMSPQSNEIGSTYLGATPSGTENPIQQASMRPVDDIYKYLTDYARERPEVCAMWAFGIGFVLGWKLKPW
jgi:hypothetical protein